MLFAGCQPWNESENFQRKNGKGVSLLANQEAPGTPGCLSRCRDLSTVMKDEPLALRGDDTSAVGTQRAPFDNSSGRIERDPLTRLVLIPQTHPDSSEPRQCLRRGIPACPSAFALPSTRRPASVRPAARTMHRPTGCKSEAYGCSLQKWSWICVRKAPVSSNGHTSSSASSSTSRPPSSPSSTPTNSPTASYQQSLHHRHQHQCEQQ